MCNKKFNTTILTFCAAILLNFSAFAQQTISYKEMMEDNSYNFYEVVEKANLYFDENGRGKGSGWKVFERWRNENESKFAPTGDRKNVDFSIVSTAYRNIAASQINKTKTSLDNGWNELGPWDANNVTAHYSPGIGRVETFWVNPTNQNQIFLGSRSGGFWRTSNGGDTWENTTDFLIASGVRAIGVNPANKNEVLINVQHGGDGYTYGIYRSTDGGGTWSESQFVANNIGWGGLGDNERIYKIAYHPTVANQVFIGTSKGLYVSNDNLATWSLKISGNTTDVAFHPTNNQIVYAYNNSGTDRDYLKKSTDGGNSFSTTANFAGNSTRQIFLSICKTAPTHVYAASTSGVYKSTDEGTTFSFLVNPDETGLAFAVSDIDTNNMVYGYVDLHNSTDNGNSFTQRTEWANQNEAYIHADLRIADCINGTFYVGTDGYLAKSTDNGVTWTKINDGTAIREFYAVGTSQGNYDVHMAGSQDNGTSILAPSGWIEWNGGDGMEALVHPLNPDWMIGSWQYGSRNYTRDGGQTRPGTGNPNRGSGNAAWEAPFLQNPMDQMAVIHFSDSLFAGDRFGQDWRFKGDPNIGVLTEAAIADSDSNTIVVARGGVIRLTTDGGNTWSNISSNLPNYTFTALAFDPKDANTIVATYNRYQIDSRKIYITFDQGATWENITYNLGAMPLRTVVMDHSDSAYIYVGGEIGVYYKSKFGTTWTKYDNNLPNVTVKDLEIHWGSNRLRAATWGRGLWEYSLVDRKDFPSITHTSITSMSNDNSPKEDVDQHVFANIDYKGTLGEVKVIWSVGTHILDQSIPMTNVGDNQWKSSAPIASSQLGEKLFFKVVATAINGDKSETYMFNYVVKEFNYCDAAGSAGTGSDYINSVSLNGTTTVSGKEGYADFTDTIIDLERGQNYTLTVGMQHHFEGQDSVTAWIDYNYDADFATDEQIIFSSIDQDHNATATFTVPNTALMEKPIRLRVRNQYYSSSMISCGDAAGEVEDYTINISEDPFVEIKEVPTILASLSPNPSNGSFRITLAETTTAIYIEMYDLTGKVVLQNTFNATNTIQLDTELSKGTYLVKISTEKGSTMQKVVIN